MVDGNNHTVSFKGELPTLPEHLSSLPVFSGVRHIYSYYPFNLVSSNSSYLVSEALNSQTNIFLNVRETDGAINNGQSRDTGNNRHTIARHKMKTKKQQ